MKGVRLLLLAAAATAALAAPASAGPTKTIRLAWNERATVGSRTVMTFNVRSLTIRGSRWTVDVSFRNTSRSSLHVRKHFALLYGANTGPVSRMKVLPARAFQPALPATLRPGKAWSGRLSGPGATALTRTSVRVRFSYFVGRVLPGSPGLSWITDHVVLLS